MSMNVTSLFSAVPMGDPLSMGGGSTQQRGIWRCSEKRNYAGKHAAGKCGYAGQYPAAGRQRGHEQGDDLRGEGRRGFPTDDAGAEQDCERLPRH